MNPLRYLIVVDAAPYGSLACREALDVALALGAFDQTVSLLLRGPAVNCLRGEQNPGVIDQKSLARNLGAASLYGVEAILAPQDDLRRYGVDQTHTDVPFTAIETAKVDMIINQYDRVIQFG